MEENTKGKPGRPEKPINWDLLDVFLKSGVNQKRICESFFIDPETLRYKVKEKYGVEYSVYSASKSGEGEALLEAAQYQKAMKGYWPAMQWLGKVRLGQREPEMLNQLAANQQFIDQSHEIMMLRAENEALKAERDASNKSETE